MPCYHPLRAWKYVRSGSIVFREPSSCDVDGGVARPLRLPCGNCIGCRTARAQQWALRCNLELQRHSAAAFATLTYDDRFLPPTLRKDDLSAYLKRLRQAVRRDDLARRAEAEAEGREPPPFREVRFFASGEYGDRFGRPHYHCILFGLHPERDKNAIVGAWGVRGVPFGIVDVDTVTPKVISYVAGYVSKKLGDRQRTGREEVDPETGEVYRWQPAFIHQSRNPGIGASARQHVASWRKFAVLGGTQIGVPRYLHEAWKKNASESDVLELEEEKRSAWVFRSRDDLKAGEANALARHKLSEQRRSRRG